FTLQGKNKVTAPDVAEFVSALAAGGGARLLVDVPAGPAGPTTLALLTAAQQTGGRAACIVRGPEELRASIEFLGPELTARVNLVVGDAARLLPAGADFVLVDCRLENHARVFGAAQAGAAEAGGGLVVVRNAALCDLPAVDGGGGGLRVDLLPIGGGLRVCRVPTAARRSQWVVRVDECSGEEHVFRITSPRKKWIEAS
ncbi:uncharacterized protein LOC121980924, partial [Zingiber officinale]|uniref:uncharacterized protein LOC121980924 n=1 Tax=Zingiber officinale TaxID=94328 RepID=UPI001C4D1E00